MAAEFYASSRKKWRSWLSENHTQTAPIWLVYYKRQTRKPSITYVESVKEALCFGWIDGGMRGIDAERYKYRFTPRKAASKWSPRNIEMALELIENGTMEEPGLVAFNRRVEYDQALLRIRQSKDVELLPEIEEYLRSDRTAWTNFNNLAPSYRKQYIVWLQAAKKPETRKKRMQEAVELLSRNRKLGMK